MNKVIIVNSIVGYFQFRPDTLNTSHSHLFHYKKTIDNCIILAFKKNENTEIIDKLMQISGLIETRLAEFD